jgi:hypothetical protein
MWEWILPVPNSTMLTDWIINPGRLTHAWLPALSSLYLLLYCSGAL